MSRHYRRDSFLIIVLLGFCNLVFSQVNSTEDVLEKEIESRKSVFSKMYHQGEKSVDIKLKDISLYEIKSEYIILIFWKTDCPYCKSLLKIIDESLEITDSRKLQIIMISLNEKIGKTDFPFQKAYPNVIHFEDGESFFGNVAKAYNIFATPTMIILDKNYCFVKLPKNIEELKLYLKK